MLSVNTVKVRFWYFSIERELCSAVVSAEQNSRFLNI